MMRINSKVRLLAAASLLALCSVASAADDAALEEVRAKMSTMFEQIGPENITRSPVDGWFTVHKGSIIAYVSEDGRYLLQGDMIDLDTQKNLSEETRSIARRAVMKSIDDSMAITFSPDEVKHRVTIFTDVDCTYCRRLHSQIDEYLAAGIEVSYLLYPRNGPASRSWSTSEEIWCSRDRNHALTAAKLDRSFESQKCNSSAVTESYMLGQDVGLTGTPAILFEDGTLVSGYLPPATLAGRLQLMQESSAN
jgi:thiol:disulfide interchange protein DsbC